MERPGDCGSALRATSLEDISLKSLAPASLADSAALRARLQNGSSAHSQPLCEDEQGDTQ